jgi:hypothetical protein
VAFRRQRFPAESQAFSSLWINDSIGILCYSARLFRLPTRRKVGETTRLVGLERVVSVSRRAKLKRRMTLSDLAAVVANPSHFHVCSDKS